MKTILKTLMVLVILVGVGGNAIQEVEAQTTMSKEAGLRESVPSLHYRAAAPPARTEIPLGDVTMTRTVCTGSILLGRTCVEIGSWTPGLGGVTAKINYAVKLIHSDGYEISNVASLPTGTKFRIERATIPWGTDIQWNGTGYTIDSPIGRWVNNAGPTTDACMPWNHIQDITNSLGETFGVHAMLNVAPSTPTIFSSGNVSCTGDWLNNTCTVTGGGNIRVGMSFAPTVGKFYYRYFDYRWDWAGCHGNNIPMTAVPSSGTPYDVKFHGADVAFNLTGQAQTPDYKASCSDVTLNPNTPLTPGQVFGATITTRNDGNSTAIWSAANGIALWSPTNIWGPQVLNMLGSTAPGGQYKFGNYFTAPTDPGTYNFSWRMAQGFTGFGDTCTKQITVVAPTCTGPIPSSMNGSSLSADEEQNVPTGTSWTYSSSNTGAKCEYTCAYGFERQGNACVPIPGSCSAPLANSSFYDDDEKASVPSVNYPSTYSDIDTGTKCQLTCNAGYSWNGSSCVQLPDLVAGKPTASAVSVRRGETIDLTGLIANNGLASAGPYEVRYFFIDKNSSRVAEYLTPATAITGTTNPGETKSTTGSWTIPNDAPIGTKYSVAYAADITNVVDEGTGDGPWSNGSDWSATFTVVEGPICVGTLENAKPHNDDNDYDRSGLTTDTNKSYSSTDTGAKCEFYCQDNYNWDDTAKACVSNTGQTGSIDLAASRPSASPSSDPADIDPATGIYDNVRVLLQINNIGTKKVNTPHSGIPYMARITGVADSQIGTYTESIDAGGESSSLEVELDNVPSGEQLEVCARVNLDGSNLYPEDSDLTNNESCTSFSLDTLEPPMSITTNKQYIRRDETADVTWEVNSARPLSCVVKGAGGISDGPFDPADRYPSPGNAYKLTKTTTTLSNTSEFRLTCTVVETGQKFEKTAVVNIIPKPEET